MAESLIVYAKTGELRMIVHDAANPDDPAWTPPGCVTVKIDRSAYDRCSGHLALMEATKAEVAKRDLTAATNIQAKLDKAAADEAAKVAELEAAALVTPEQDEPRR